MADGNGGGDRRSFGLRRARIHAMLLVPGRPPSPCIVRNYSPSGAMIDIGEELDPPYNVKLRLFDTGDEIECEVRSCKNWSMGVRFLGRDACEALSAAANGGRRRRHETVAAEPVVAQRPVSGNELRRRVLGISKV